MLIRLELYCNRVGPQTYDPMNLRMSQDIEIH